MSGCQVGIRYLINCGNLQSLAEPPRRLLEKAIAQQCTRCTSKATSTSLLQAGTVTAAALQKAALSPTARRPKLHASIPAAEDAWIHPKVRSGRVSSKPCLLPKSTCIQSCSDCSTLCMSPLMTYHAAIMKTYSHLADLPPAADLLQAQTQEATKRRPPGRDEPGPALRTPTARGLPASAR